MCDWNQSLYTDIAVWTGIIQKHVLKDSGQDEAGGGSGQRLWSEHRYLPQRRQYPNGPLLSRLVEWPVIASPQRQSDGSASGIDPASRLRATSIRLAVVCGHGSRGHNLQEGTIPAPTCKAIAVRNGWNNMSRGEQAVQGIRCLAKRKAVILFKTFHGSRLNEGAFDDMYSGDQYLV